MLFFPFFSSFNMSLRKGTALNGGGLLEHLQVASVLPTPPQACSMPSSMLASFNLSSKGVVWWMKSHWEDILTCLQDIVCV